MFRRFSIKIIKQFSHFHFSYLRAQDRAATRRPNDSLLLSLVAPVVVLSFAATLRGRRRPGEAAKALGRRIGEGAGGCEDLVSRRRCRADAGRAHSGVAGFLAEATALTETGDVAGALEAEITGTADHVLDHATQFRATLAAVLDDHRLAEVAPFRDVSHVAAPQQRRLLELALLPLYRAGDRYVGMKVVLRIGQTALRSGRTAGVLRGRRRRAVQIVLPRQLRRRRG